MQQSASCLITGNDGPLGPSRSPTCSALPRMSTLLTSITTDRSPRLHHSTDWQRDSALTAVCQGDFGFGFAAVTMSNVNVNLLPQVSSSHSASEATPPHPVYCGRGVRGRRREKARRLEKGGETLTGGGLRGDQTRGVSIINPAG